ncbi:MAG: rubredoxin, partial [Muribaculaceae bacterium]|nr:rubredoxin [Muribaculaceae bacterium]
ICHYIAEVDGELPDDYTCPVCGVDRSFFNEII